ncbi:discoidin domain-containing protein [Actinacidiphila yeochonensis]|uniref:discoidin domain-containing protein n=1 Tax=Actinacidiphila yeochonensis TaxID=89050 RepID=UPI00068F2782|nr:discoidin domain-containing protein [Actinacidiphila yeochonensis]
MPPVSTAPPSPSETASAPAVPPGRRRPHGRVLALLAALAAALLLAAGLGTGTASAAPKQSITLGTDTGLVTVTPVPCAVQGFQLRFGNTGGSAVYADAFVAAPAPLTVSRPLVSSYLPPGYTLKVRVQVSAPRGTPPGDYTVTVHSGSASLAVPVHVTAPPVDSSGDLLRYTRVSASSEKLPAYPACGAFDGDRDSAHWGASTGWNDATKGAFPDWLQSTFDQPERVGRVDLYTLDSATYPAAKYGLSDWDVQLLADGGWQTVARVRGNTAGEAGSSFTPVTATALRVVTLAGNEGPTYSRVVELEAYGS